LGDLVDAAQVHEIEGDSRVFSAEGKHNGGNEVCGGGSDERYAKMAGLAASGLAGASLGFYETVQDVCSVALKDGSGWRESDGAAIAVEELNAEVRLKLLDVGGEGRLREMKDFCGAGEIEPFGDGQKRSEMAKLHGCSSKSVSHPWVCGF
jgi:hypothetical protein